MGVGAFPYVDASVKVRRITLASSLMSHQISQRQADKSL